MDYLEDKRDLLEDEDGFLMSDLFVEEADSLEDIESSGPRRDYEWVSYNHADFRRRYMSFVNIVSSEFRFSSFEGVNLIGSLLKSTDFYGASFRSADLEYCEVEKCEFSSVDLNRINLQGARLRRSNFSYSDLRGANLSDCIIERCGFRGALFDDDTILPFDNDRALELGMVYTPDLLNAG